MSITLGELVIVTAIAMAKVWLIVMIVRAIRR